MKTIIGLALLCLLASPSLAQFKVGDSVMVGPTTTRLNVRTGAGVTFPAITAEPTGTIGTVIGGPASDTSFTFYQIKWSDGISGWSAAPYLVEAAPPSGSFPATARDSLMYRLGAAHAVHDTTFVDPDSLEVGFQGFWRTGPRTATIKLKKQ
jgi:hypothetical protein